MSIDTLRLTVQGVLAIGVLAGATFLAKAGIITSDAVVGLYSVALGAVGAGAVGGYRAQQIPHDGEPIPHIHHLDGGDKTQQPEKT